MLDAFAKKAAGPQSRMRVQTHVHNCQWVRAGGSAGELLEESQAQDGSGWQGGAARLPAISPALGSGWHLAGAQFLLTERMGQVPTQTYAPKVKRETSREGPLNLQGCSGEAGSYGTMPQDRHEAEAPHVTWTSFSSAGSLCLTSQSAHLARD